MTTVTFLTEESRIIGFDAIGHSGWSEAGSDIVCAAITSAVRLVDATINTVMGLCAAESTCQNVMTGLMVFLAELHDEYPKNIEVMEA